MSASRIAVVDIGTNTLLLLVAEPDGAGGLRSIHDDCRFGRLGQGLDASGELAPEAIERSLDIIRAYRADMDRLGVARVVAVGTQALREASNAAVFVEPASALLGVAIEVVPGEREAELVSIAVTRTMPELAGQTYAIADVGGGSTEIIVCAGTEVRSFTSVKLGSVRHKERYLAHDPPEPDEVAAVIADIDRTLEALALPAGVPLVGTAGTATTIAAVELGLDSYDADRVQGTRVSAAAVQALLARLLGTNAEGRAHIPGVEPQRADVIQAGVAIYARLLRRLGTPEMIVSDRGIRWGLAYELADHADQ
jgi:exopolyphosphatase/guanosine-5'-triphosphate,3'-diphosphate pyrophosphatase